MCKTRAQAKVQANTPTMPNTQPKKQKTTPKTTRVPIQTRERKREFKAPPSRMAQQMPRNIVLPPEFMLPPIVMPPNNRPPPKSLNIEETDTDSHRGPDPRMDIEENSPHQEEIITKSYVAPDQSYLVQPQELIRLVNTLNFIQKHLL